MRDCLNQKNRLGIQPLNRFCEDFGIKHLVQDCPFNPEAKGKVAINFIEVVPPTSSPISSETKQTVPINVIMRAQAKAQEKERENKDEMPSKSIKSS